MPFHFRLNWYVVSCDCRHVSTFLLLLFRLLLGKIGEGVSLSILHYQQKRDLCKFGLVDEELDIINCFKRTPLLQKIAVGLEACNSFPALISIRLTH